jgi:hypothetical protein
LADLNSPVQFFIFQDSARNDEVSRWPIRSPGTTTRFASFINTWIDLKRKDGTIETLYNYWVLGREAAHRQPRWSIIHDVLHWVD